MYVGLDSVRLLVARQHMCGSGSLHLQLCICSCGFLLAAQCNAALIHTGKSKGLIALLCGLMDVKYSLSVAMQ